MISLTALGLVISGAFILVGALIPVRQLMLALPPGAIRNRWRAMTALIMLFLAGYLGYAAVFWNNHSSPLDLIVPGVFFLGACFVWLTASLSLQTTKDVMRISDLERETVIDPLTGVFNRRYLNRRLSEEVAIAQRYGLPLSLLLLDIDHFKLVNDRCGHQTGDRVLVTLGKVAVKAMRESDVLTRYGGEEFMVIAPHTDLLGATQLAERMRKQIESHDFGLTDEDNKLNAAHVTASIGVASLGDGVDDGESLIHAADENLYRAKQEGRNRVVASSQAK